MKYIIDFDGFINESNTSSDLKRLDKLFPDTATKWSQATDEIQTLAQYSRELLLDYQDIEGEMAQLRGNNGAKTPSEWNQRAKKAIHLNFSKMNNKTKKLFIEKIKEMFSK